MSAAKNPRAKWARFYRSQAMKKARDSKSRGLLNRCKFWVDAARTENRRLVAALIAKVQS